MKRSKTKLIFLSLCLVYLFTAQMALAQTGTVQPIADQYHGPEQTIKDFLCAPTTNTGAQQTGNSFGAAWTAAGTSGAGTAGSSNTAAGDLYNCINRLYRFAIILASIGAVLYIVIAGYLYMSSEGNSEMVDKAKSYVTSAITAIVILLAGYIVLRFLNPDLIQFRNIQPPSVTPGTTSAPSTLPSTSGASSATEDQLRSQFIAKGISINAQPPQTTLAGMQQATVNEIITLKNNCGSSCGITITGGTESGQHTETGTCTHIAGYKVDLALNTNLDNYIKKFQTLPTRKDGAAQWYDSTSNTTFALETTQGTGQHWDISVNCSS